MGIQIMVNLNYNKAFFNILFIAGIINIILAIIFVPYLQHIGMSISVIISCIFVAVAQFLYLKAKKINILKGGFDD